MDNKKLKQTICGEQPRHRNSFVSYLLRMFLLLAVMVCGAGNAWGGYTDGSINNGVDGKNGSNATWTQETKTYAWTTKTNNAFTVNGLTNLSQGSHLILDIADLKGEYRVYITIGDKTYHRVLSATGQVVIDLKDNNWRTNVWDASTATKLPNDLSSVTVYFAGLSNSGSLKVNSFKLASLDAFEIKEAPSSDQCWLRQYGSMKVAVKGFEKNLSTTNGKKFLKLSKDTENDSHIKLIFPKGMVKAGDILTVKMANYYNDAGTVGFSVSGGGSANADNAADGDIDVTYKIRSANVKSEDENQDCIILTRKDYSCAFNSFEISSPERYIVKWDNSKVKANCDAWYTIDDDPTEYRTTTCLAASNSSVTYHVTSIGSTEFAENGWHLIKGETDKHLNDIEEYKSLAWINPMTWTVTEDVNIYPEFTTVHYIKATAETIGGNVVGTAKAYTNTETKEDISTHKYKGWDAPIVYFEATPISGYQFDGWYRDGEKVSDKNPWDYGKYSESSNLILTAKFVPNNHTVTFSTNDPAMGTVTATVDGNTIKSGSTVAHGTQVTFTATPIGTNVFHWWNGKSGVPATVTVTVNEDVNYEAIFHAGVDFKAYAGLSSMGSVTIKQDDSNKGTSYHSAPYPQNLIYVATPKSGFTFAGWYTDEARTQAFKTKNGTAITASEINLTTLYDNGSDAGISGDYRTNGLTLYAKFTANKSLGKPECNHYGDRTHGSNYFDITKLYTNLDITDYSQKDGRTITVPPTGGNMSYFFDNEYNFGDLKSWTISDNKDLQDRISYVNFYDANGNLLLDFYTDAGNRTSLDDASKKKLNKVKEIRIGFKGNSDKYPVTETLSYTFQWICFTFEHADRVKPVLSEGTATEMRVFTGENLILANGSGFWRQYTDNTYKTVKSDGFIHTNEWEKRYEIPAEILTKDADYYFRVVDEITCALGYTHSSEAVDVHVKVTDPINTVEVNGTTRQYDVYAPEGITSSESSKVGVVISLHGASNDYWNGRVDFNSIAETEKYVDGKKFIVVYPRGLMRQLRGTERGWETYTESNTEDVEFFKAIVTELKKTYSVDMSRIYLAGFSNGGMMAYKAAHQAGDFFAAFASVGGFPVNESHLFHAGSQPTPFIHIQGAADAVFKSDTYDLSTIAHNMTYRNGAHFNPNDEGYTYDGGVIPTHANVTREIHVADEGGAAYFLYKIAGMGHTWSYNWDDKLGDDVAQSIWNFFDYSGKVNKVDPTLKFRMYDPDNFWTMAKNVGFDKVDEDKSVLSYGGRTKTDDGTTTFNKDTNNRNLWHSLQFNGGINGAAHFLKLNVKTNKVQNENPNQFFLVKLTKTGDTTPVFAKRYQAGRGQKDLYINFVALPGFNEYKLEITKSSSELVVEIHGMEFYSGRCEDKSQEENPTAFYDVATVLKGMNPIYQPVFDKSYAGIAKEFLPIADIPVGVIPVDDPKRPSDIPTTDAEGKHYIYKVINNDLVGNAALTSLPSTVITDWDGATTKTISRDSEKIGKLFNIAVSGKTGEDKDIKSNNAFIFVPQGQTYTIDKVKGLCISQHGRAMMPEYLNGTRGAFPDHGVIAIKLQGTLDFYLLAQNEVTYEGTDPNPARRTLKVYYTNDQLDGELKELKEWWFFGTRSEDGYNDKNGQSLAALSAGVRLPQLGMDGTCTVFITYEGNGQGQSFSDADSDHDKIWIKGFVIKRPDLKVTIGRTDSKYSSQDYKGEDNTKCTRFGENKPYVWSFENVGFNNTKKADITQKKINAKDGRTYVCGGTDDSNDHVLLYSDGASDKNEDKVQFDGRVAGQEHIEFLKASQYNIPEATNKRKIYDPIQSNGLKVNVTGSGWFKIQCAAPNGPVNMKVYTQPNYGESYISLLREFRVEKTSSDTDWKEYTVYLKSRGIHTGNNGFWDGTTEDAGKEEIMRQSLFVVFDEVKADNGVDTYSYAEGHPQLNIHQLSWLNEEPADYVFQREEDPKLLTTWQAIRRGDDGNKTLDDNSDANVVLYWMAGTDKKEKHDGYFIDTYNRLGQMTTNISGSKGVKSPGGYASTSVPSDAGTYDAYWDIAAPALTNAHTEKAYANQGYDYQSSTEYTYNTANGGNTEFDMPISGSFIRICAMKNTYVVAHVLPGATNGAVYVLDETGSPIPFVLSGEPSSDAKRLGYITSLSNIGEDKEGGKTTSDGTIRIDFKANAGKEYFICAKDASISLARLEIHDWRHKPAKASDKLMVTDNEATNSTTIAKAYDDAVANNTYYRDASLTRTFAAEKWASLVLPFSLNEKKFEKIFGTNAKVLHFTDFDGKTCTLKFTRHFYNIIVAGRPVFVWPTKEVKNPDFNDITLQTKTVRNTDTPSGFSFVGSYDNADILRNDLYMNNNNVIKYINKNSTYPGMRSFIKNNGHYDFFTETPVAAGVKAVLLSFDDDEPDMPTGIEELVSAEFGEDVVVVTKTTKIYDLLGNVIGEGSDIKNLPTGVYIVNGKKYYVK